MAIRVPHLLATAVATACSLSAQASGPTQADYAKVVLYSNVTIAQDSASQWGIWEELEPPAAGPQTPLPLIAGTSEPYRPLGSVTPTTPVTPPTVATCVSGAMCGFGVMTSIVSPIDFEQAQEVSKAPLLRTGFQMVPIVTQANADTNQWLPQAVLMNIDNVRNDVPGSPTFANLGPLELQPTEMGGYHRFESDQPGAYDVAEIATDTSNPGTGDAGMFLGDIVIARYVSGSNPEQISGTQQQNNIYGVWGVTTSAQDMSNLRASNAQASYSGFTFGADGASTGSVKMSVNFGTSSFTADFNGGLNVQNPLVGGQVQTTANGTVQVAGALAFRASGAINGSLFSANSLQIAAPGSSITGKVEGAFFGSNAAVAAGVVDVSAVLPPPGLTTPVYARYAAPFVTVKDVPNNQPK